VAGALAFLHHHLALETCGEDLPFEQPSTGSGPPFRTRDGHLVEIEALLGRDWTQFWVRLGIGDEVAGDAWLPFAFRFLTGRCALPRSLHDAIARRTWAEVREAAVAADVSVCRLRSYAEVLREPSQRDASWPVDDRAPLPVEETGDTAGRTDAPLAGLRVVEVTSRLQGPLAALLLRQLGAAVIKVEPPGGDFGRKSAPRAGTVGAAYLSYNRAKERIELDYKKPADRARLVELAAGADVFLQNWPPGRAEALGLDAPSLARVNPAIVYAHAAGWGRGASPPCLVASDYLVQAHAGLGDGLYHAGEPARPSRLTLVDVLGGLLACEAVLAGLYRRAVSRRHQYVETSLYGAAMTLQAHVLDAIGSRDEIGRTAGRPRWDLLDQPLAAADDYIFAGPLTADMRRNLADVCGLRGYDAAAIAATVREKSAASWLDALRSLGIPTVVVCRRLRCLPADSVAAPWLERVEDRCWVPGAPWRFSA
jgi:crotonobetainyl-CoA:carnitine CoA-transferase CaiB-like acyl-CoA transferase